MPTRAILFTMAVAANAASQEKPPAIVQSEFIFERAAFPLTLNTANFDERVLRSDKTVVVDFWAPWCPACRVLGPAIDRLAEERPDLVVGKLNVDDSQDVADRYGVRGHPDGAGVPRRGARRQERRARALRKAAGTDPAGRGDARAGRSRL